ncbi:MAG: hypothetical protein RMJ97_01630 [Raineya sp.]|nr:hypothetical protein [Raineya sp.]
MKEREILQQAYQQAQSLNIEEFDWNIRKDVDVLIENIEKNKSLVAAVITSLLKKIVQPTQDIRLHRTDFEQGYSARILDTQVTTPFFKEKFPRYANKETAFLTLATRERIRWDKQEGQNLKIRNQLLKESFLNIFEQIEVHQANPQMYLHYILAKLIHLSSQENQTIDYLNLSITCSKINIYSVLQLLKEFFSTPQSSRLPVIAIYSIYEVLMNKFERYKDKKLLPLQVHTSPDKHTLGDIEIYTESNQPFEIIEIKHNIPIEKNIILDVCKKISNLPVNRYYILTTFENTFSDAETEMQIVSYISEILKQTGTEIIVNGIIASLKYYLRFIDDYTMFLQSYTDNLKTDFLNSTEIKSFHLSVWQELLEKYEILFQNQNKLE